MIMTILFFRFSLRFVANIIDFDKFLMISSYLRVKRLDDALKALSGRVLSHPTPRGSEQVPAQELFSAISNSVETSDFQELQEAKGN